MSDIPKLYNNNLYPCRMGGFADVRGLARFGLLAVAVRASARTATGALHARESRGGRTANDRILCAALHVPGLERRRAQVRSAAWRLQGFRGRPAAEPVRARRALEHPRQHRPLHMTLCSLLIQHSAGEIIYFSFRLSATLLLIISLQDNRFPTVHLFKRFYHIISS